MGLFTGDDVCDAAVLNAGHDFSEVSTSVAGWAVSLCFAIVACLISGRLIYLHMANYTNPNQQRYIIRILLMVPIYAIISWFSYYFYAHFIYYELVRDCYEAFVIASFFILLLQYLADTPALQRDSLLIYKGRVMRVAFPFCCFHYDAGSTHYLQFLKYCIMQYVVLRPVCTIIAVIMQAAGVYCPDSYHPNHGNLWITIIETISVTVSLYALIQLYMTIKKDIAQHKPLIKFLSVKGIVFLVFWQALLISLLSSADVIRPSEFWSADAIANGISSFLLCVEMVPFAILHHKAFPSHPYRVKPGSGKVRARGTWAAMVDSLNPADFLWEIIYGLKYLLWWVGLAKRPIDVSGGREVTMDIQSVLLDEPEVAKETYYSYASSSAAADRMATESADASTHSPPPSYLVRPTHPSSDHHPHPHGVHWDQGGEDGSVITSRGSPSSFGHYPPTSPYTTTSYMRPGPPPRSPSGTAARYYLASPSRIQSPYSPTRSQRRSRDSEEERKMEMQRMDQSRQE